MAKLNNEKRKNYVFGKIDSSFILNLKLWIWIVLIAEKLSFLNHFLILFRDRPKPSYLRRNRNIMLYRNLSQAETGSTTLRNQKDTFCNFRTDIETEVVLNTKLIKDFAFLSLYLLSLELTPINNVFLLNYNLFSLDFYNCVFFETLRKQILCCLFS